MFTVMHLGINLVLLGLPTLKQFSVLGFFLFYVKWLILLFSDEKFLALLVLDVHQDDLVIVISYKWMMMIPKCGNISFGYPSH